MFSQSGHCALHPLIGKGYLAVDMFFMLSGFVMTHVYYRAFSERIVLHYRGFLVARIARLYPLHIFMLLFVVTAVTSQLMAGSRPARCRASR